MIKETCNSTLTIDSVQQRMLKADLHLKSVYGENMELLKYYNIFMSQAKVAWEEEVNFDGKTVVKMIYDKILAKDSATARAPAFFDSLVKLERKGMDIESL